MKKLNVQKLTLCGVMAALVFVMTYFPKIPVPVTGGYVHLGDGAIFLSVLLLGPLGIPAAAVGSMLSDLIGGYMVYVLPTFLIKGLVALVAWKLCRKDQPLLALLSFLLAEAVMVLGYFLLEWALYGVASAAAAIGPNVVQGIAGVLIGMLCLLMPMVFHYGRRWHLFSMMQKNLLMGDKSGGKCAIIVYWKGIPFPPKRRPDARKPCVKSLDKGKL